MCMSLYDVVDLITCFPSSLFIHRGSIDFAVPVQVISPDLQVVRIFINLICKYLSILCESNHLLCRAVVQSLQAAVILVLNPIAHIQLGVLVYQQTCLQNVEILPICSHLCRWEYIKTNI